MKNNIYDMINDGTFENEDYNIEVLSDVEKKKYKTNVRKSIGGREMRRRKYKGIAAAVIFAVLGTGFLGTDVGAQVMIEVSESIGSALRVDKNIDDYKTVINKCVSDNGINIQLNEVVLDRNSLIISAAISSEKKLEEYESYDAEESVYINNKKVKITGATGSSRNIDEYTTESVMEYDLDSLDESDLTGELNIKIIYTSVSINHENRVRGKWKFEFKTNGDALKIDTYKTALNYKLSLPNGKEIDLDEYSSNAIGNHIYASVNNGDMNSKEDYDLRFKGYDNIGNEVMFYLSRGREDYMDFKYDNFDRNIDDNVKTLTLAPYAVKMPEQSGKMPDSDEYVKIGDEFTIDINK